MSSAALCRLAVGLDDAVDYWRLCGHRGQAWVLHRAAVICRRIAREERAEEAAGSRWAS